MTIIATAIVNLYTTIATILAAEVIIGTLQVTHGNQIITEATPTISTIDTTIK
jgi:hypothetical protein